MADHTRLAAAGLFLALTLALVPAALPIRGMGTNPAQRAEAGLPAAPVIHLRDGALPLPASTSRSISALDLSRRAASTPSVSRPSASKPGASTPAVSTPAAPKPAASRISPREHVVAPGETLWRIASGWGVRVEALAAANHLSLGSLLRPGQTLIAPASGGSATAAPTRPGDASQIAKPAGVASPALHLLRMTSSWLLLPSDGRITSQFGWRIHPIFGTREFHTGLDIANRLGTPVRAAEGGIVRFVGWMAGYGRLIVVAHANGLETSYSHLSKMVVGVGDRIVRGQILGQMGSSGWSTGPHLLFELRRNGVAIDPAPFLRGVMATSEAAAAGPGPTTRSGGAVQHTPAVRSNAGAPSPSVPASVQSPAAPASATSQATATAGAPAAGTHPASPPPAVSAPEGGATDPFPVTQDTSDH